MLLLPLSASGRTDDDGGATSGCEDTGRRFQSRRQRKCPEMTRRGRPGGGRRSWWRDGGDSTQVSHHSFYGGRLYTRHLCSSGFDALQRKTSFLRSRLNGETWGGGVSAQVTAGRPEGLKAAEEEAVVAP